MIRTAVSAAAVAALVCVGYRRGPCRRVGVCVPDVESAEHARARRRLAADGTSRTCRSVSPSR